MLFQLMPIRDRTSEDMEGGTVNKQGRVCKATLSLIPVHNPPSTKPPPVHGRAGRGIGCSVMVVEVREGGRGGGRSHSMSCNNVIGALL